MLLYRTTKIETPPPSKMPANPGMCPPSHTDSTYNLYSLSPNTVVSWDFIFSKVLEINWHLARHRLLRTDLGTHQIQHIFLCSKSGQGSHEYREANLGSHFENLLKAPLSEEWHLFLCLSWEAVIKCTTCLSMGRCGRIFHNDCTFEWLNCVFLSQLENSRTALNRTHRVIG